MSRAKAERLSPGFDCLGSAPGVHLYILEAARRDDFGIAVFGAETVGAGVLANQIVTGPGDEIVPGKSPIAADDYIAWPDRFGYKMQVLDLFELDESQVEGDPARSTGLGLGSTLELASQQGNAAAAPGASAAAGVADEAVAAGGPMTLEWPSSYREKSGLPAARFAVEPEEFDRLTLLPGVVKSYRSCGSRRRCS